MKRLCVCLILLSCCNVVFSGIVVFDDPILEDDVRLTLGVTGPLTALDTEPGNAFGVAVAIDGNNVIVGDSTADSESLTNSGSAYIFDVSQL